MACVILERISGLEPLSETIAPRYLKLCTVPVPSFCPYTFISLVPLALFVTSLVFSALFSILYLVQVLSRLSTRASSSCSSSAMSSANRRLVIFLPPMLTFPSCSFTKRLTVWLTVGQRGRHVQTVGARWRLFGFIYSVLVYCALFFLSR